MSEQRDIVARLRKEISKRDRPYPVELLPELREASDEIERLRRQVCQMSDEREKCHDIMESQSHQLARMARDIEMFREMVAEMRERNNKLLHKLQEFEAREAE